MAGYGGQDAGNGGDSAVLMREMQDMVINLQGELYAEKTKAKEIIIQLKREVEDLLEEGEAAAEESKRRYEVELGRKEADLREQSANVDWLQQALDKAEDRIHNMEIRLQDGTEERFEARLQRSVTQASSQLQYKVDRLQAELEAAKQEIRKAQESGAHLPDIMAERDQLREEVEKLKKEIADENTKSNILEQSMQSVLNVEKKNASAEVETLQAALAEEKAKAKKTKKRLITEKEEAIVEAQQATITELEELRTEVETLRVELEAEKSRAKKVKERLKAEVVAVMAQREEALVAAQSSAAEDVAKMQEQLDAALAELERERQKQAGTNKLGAEVKSAQDLIDSLQRENKTLTEAFEKQKTGSREVELSLHEEVVAAIAEKDAAVMEAKRSLQEQMGTLYEQLATLTTALEKEKTRTREVEVKLHGEVVTALAERQVAVLESKSGSTQEVELLRAALAAEKARARETITHLQSEKAQARTLVAQLKGEIEVQALVIERTEEVIKEKHALAAEVKRLQLALSETTERARETEIKLLGEIEVLMRSLPGSSRLAGRADASRRPPVPSYSAAPVPPPATPLSMYSNGSTPTPRRGAGGSSIPESGRTSSASYREEPSGYAPSGYAQSDSGESGAHGGGGSRGVPSREQMHSPLSPHGQAAAVRSVEDRRRAEAESQRRAHGGESDGYGSGSGYDSATAKRNSHRQFVMAQPLVPDGYT